MNSTEDMETHLACQRVGLICGPYWRENKRQIVILTVLATALMFGSSTISYFAGQMAGEATTLMQRQDVGHWSNVVQVWAFVMIGYMITTVGYEYLRTKLANDAFQYTTANVFGRWFRAGVFDKARSDARLKSPEHSMTQTIEDSFNGLVGLSMAAVTYCFDLIMGTIQLFKIDKYLVLEAIGWSIIGIVVVSSVGHSLVSLNERKGERDGALRTAITNANEVDAADVDAEREKVLACLSEVMTVRNRMMVVNRNVAGVTYPFNKWTEILGMVVMAPLFFQHLFNGATPMEIGVVTTASLAFAKSVSSMTMLVQQFGGIANWFATIKRAGVFCEVLNQYESGEKPGEIGVVSSVVDALCRLCMR